MEILATSPNAIHSATGLDIRTNNEMLKTAGQILSGTLIYCHGPTIIKLDKNYSHDDLWSEWARESRQNYRWVCQYFKTLCAVFLKHRKKNHQYEKFYDDFYHKYIHFIPPGYQTPFINSTKYQDLPTHEAYQRALKDKSVHNGINFENNDFFTDEELLYVNEIYKDSHL